MSAPGDIADAFLTACRLELAALKPGNVHVHADGHGMTVALFEAAARAAAPRVADPTLTVGQKIKCAVEASWAVANCNTNLGICLLAAPLAKAAETGSGSLRERLIKVLDALDVADAREAYAAIGLARPAGLGTVADQDVAGPPEVTLRDAMALAADRDRIARAYVTSFADIFELGLPTIDRALTLAESSDLAITTLHMTFLSAFPDSHIARKHGGPRAEAVWQRAAALASHWHPVAEQTAIGPLLAFDSNLKREGVNPGTTADLVVGTLFAMGLSGRTLASPETALIGLSPHAT